MTKPIYKVKLICDSFIVRQAQQSLGVDFGVFSSEDSTVEQLLQTVAYAFGDNNYTHQGQTFKAGLNDKLKLDKIKVKLTKTGTPSDKVKMGLWNEDGSSLLATSTTEIDASSISGTPTDFDFEFDYTMNPDTLYLFAVYRSGSQDASHYYNVRYTMLGAGYSDGKMISSDDGATTWDGPVDDESQTSFNTQVHFGKTTGKTQVGQSFKLAYGGKVTQITCGVNIGGTPTDALEMKIYDSSWSLIATSNNQPTDTWAPVFTFTNLVLDKLVEYRYMIYRTGSLDNTNFWYHRVSAGSPPSPPPYTNGSEWEYDGSYTNNLYADTVFTIDYQVYGFDLYFVATVQKTLSDVGQKFRLHHHAGDIFSLVVDLEVVGSPSGNVRAQIRNAAGTVVATSTNTVTGSGEKTFNFDYTLTPDVDYYFFLNRSTDPNDANHWKIRAFNEAVYPDGNLYTLEDTDFSTAVEEQQAAFFRAEFTSVEVDDLVTECVEAVISRGKNDVDGSIVEGVMDITFQNQGNRYSPFNSSSDLYGIFRVNSQISVEANYDSVDYNIFSGYITFIEPVLDHDSRFTHVKAVDRFYPFRNSKISIGTQSGKTANQIVVAILDDLGLTSGEYDVETDTQVLDNVTWDDEPALEKLAEVIEVGQHHHFIGGEGKYNFKNNQWLSDGTPDYSFTEADIDYAHIEDNLDGVKNIIKVKWGSSYETVESDESKTKYGDREFILENLLMPSLNNVYASFIATYLRDMFEEPGNSLVFGMSNKFPEVLDLDFGSVIAFADSDTTYTTLCNIFTITHKINPAADHQVEFATRKWVFPPNVGLYYELEPFEGNRWLTLSDDIEEGCMTFKLTSGNGTVYKTFFNFRWVLDGNMYVTIEIYAADGNGYPTGSKLAKSSKVLIGAGTGSGAKEFVFGVGERPILTVNTEYCLVFNVGKRNATETLCADDDDFILDYDVTKFSQSFKFTKPGRLSSVFIPVEWDFENSSNGRVGKVEIYQADGSGYPTGSLLTASSSKTFTNKGLQQFIEFPMSMIDLIPNQEYCAVLKGSAFFARTVDYDTGADKSATLGGENNRDKGQTFTVDEKGGKINQVIVGELWYSKTQGEKAYYKARIHNTSGGKPSGAAIAISTNEVSFGSASSAEWKYQQNVTFNFANVALNPNTQYAIIIYVSQYSNLFQIMGSNSNPYSGGTWVFKDGGGVWQINSSADAMIEWILTDRDQAIVPYGKLGNVYANGKASYYDGSWHDLYTNADIGLKLKIYEFVTDWKVWGQDTNVYANGRPSEKNYSVWESLSPEDFWFKLEVLTVT